MAENAPFCTENFKNFLRPAARTMHVAGTIFVPPTFQMKVTPLNSGLGMPKVSHYRPTANFDSFG